MTTDRHEDIPGSHLIRRIEELIAEGNARALRIHSHDGKLLAEVPLTAGVLTGGVVVLAAPWLAVIGAIAGAVANVRVEIVREDREDDGAASGESQPNSKPRQSPPGRAAGDKP
jgi:hypothetical protein